MYMPLMNKTWKIVDEAPDYEVSVFGDIRRRIAKGNSPAGHILSPKIGGHGYRQVGLSVDGKVITRNIHRLVCIAFHGTPPEKGLQAAHKNGDRLDNRACNLRWLTPSENQKEKRIHGTMPDQKGENSHKAILNDEAVAIIRSTKRYNGVLPDLAKRFGVSENTVMQLRTRGCRKWGHIQPHSPAISAD